MCIRDRYFFELLMKADTEIAFGEEFVVLDTRTDPVFKAVSYTHLFQRLRVLLRFVTCGRTLLFAFFFAPGYASVM